MRNFTKHFLAVFMFWYFSCFVFHNKYQWYLVIFMVFFCCVGNLVLSVLYHIYLDSSLQHSELTPHVLCATSVEEMR